MAKPGYLALILHAHLPFVRHPEHIDFLEEDWLYEAIVETYVPLLQMMRGLVADGVNFTLTMSMTPPLCAMLRDPLLQERALRYMDRAIGLADVETDRNRQHPELAELSHFYAQRFRSIKSCYEECQGDLVKAFGDLQEKGFLEIITCGATHGFLPLLTSFPESTRAQIFIARDSYAECFGREPRGIWLPECAYTAGVEKILAEADIRWFLVDTHGMMFGNPRPRYAVYAPCYTPAGPAVFGRDRESSRQIWSSEEGYPGDPAYRDFYRDAGFDLPEEVLKPFLPANGFRKFTGLKYHRITGRTPQKDWYRRSWAMAAADANANHFIQARIKQLEQLTFAMNVDPIVVSPYDAELFGHWWYEGPEFLNLVIRKAVYDQKVFQLTTPSRYLEKNPTHQMMSPCDSSWGHKGYWEVWLDESNSWIYPHVHMACRRMHELAAANRKTKSPWKERTLKQMARELLLAQSSDWAFLMKTGTAREYATKRTKDHILRFTRLYDQLKAGTVDEEFLATCESRDNLLPDVNWRYYC